MTERNRQWTESGEGRFGFTIALLGVVVVLLCTLLESSPMPWPELLLLGLLAWYGEWRSVKLPGFGIVNPGEGFYLAAACLYGPVAGALLALLLGVLGDWRKKKRAALMLFNMGWSLSTFCLAGLAYLSFGLLGAGLVYTLVAGVLQAFGERTFSGLTLSQTSKHQCKEMLLLGPAVFLFAYLTIELFSLRSPVVLLLLLPVELMVTYVKTRELSLQLQQTLEDLEKAQSELVASGRKAALGVMAAGVAHEINNPLAAAVTNVHMLKMMASDKTLSPCIALLEKSIDRCQSIVARMLKYSRQSSAGGVPCHLQEMVEDALLFCGRKFSEETVRFESRLEPEAVVLGEPTELVQILSNLIGNAHDSGASSVVVESRLEDGMLCVRVCDDGSGIPEKVAERIFDPFFTTKEVGAGTGLGLSIAQSLARGMGGDLALRERSKGRTVFEVSLRPCKL